MALQAGAILISPQSRTRTWDVIRDGFGKDVESIDNALDSAFGTYNIDREHLAIGGFSDGASYALSLGLTNGQLFSHIIAFSPGFMVPGKKVGLSSCWAWCQLLDATHCHSLSTATWFTYLLQLASWDTHMPCQHIKQAIVVTASRALTDQMLCRRGLHVYLSLMVRQTQCCPSTVAAGG